MNSSKLNDWLQVAASIGVVLSLIFVGLEIQQSRKIAIADIFQQRAAMAIQVQQGAYSDVQYANALDKLLSGEALSESEVGLLKFVQNPWFQYWENSFFQYEIGLLSEATWQSSRNTIKGRFCRPIYQEWWEAERGHWSENFAREVDEIILEIKARQHSC